MITNNEYQILHHTLTRATNNAYCSNESTVKSLIDKGLMQFHCKLSYVPEPYWTVTDKGKKEYLTEYNKRQSKRF
jgi:hypothetical protein